MGRMELPSPIQWILLTSIWWHFADNSTSAHYSTKFQNIKEQDERIRIDSTSHNTYNKLFGLTYLRRSIMKVKTHAHGPNGIRNNLLKHLPKYKFKVFKEILNDIWTSDDFLPQWKAASVIPIHKANMDHTNPLSYRPTVPTSCLCKVLERIPLLTHISYVIPKNVVYWTKANVGSGSTVVPYRITL